MIASRAISSVDAALKMVTLLPELRLFTISCYPSHRVQWSFVWINELLISSLTLKNVYACRSARLICPMGSLWIYCKRFLRCLSLLFAILKINNRKPYPRWRTERRPKGDRRLSPEVRPRYEVPSKSRSCEPSGSWFAVDRMCNETVNAIKITHFFRGFRRVLMF